MATYNRAHLIVETIRSIQAQEFENFECIIVDDGGQDNTAAVLQPILKEDSRFSFLKRPESYAKGLPGCRNCGIDRAKGNYIIFFDDDDIVHPDNLKLCVHYLEESQKEFCRYLRAAFYGEFDYKFDRSTSFASFPINGKKEVYKMISGSLPFNSCAVMWKANQLKENPFKEDLMYAEEWECYSRILANGAQGTSLEKVLFFGRKHSKSNTGEYRQKNPKRITGKIKATRYIMDNLDSKNLMSPPLNNYFLALGKGMKERTIFDHLLNLKSLGPKEKSRLRLRSLLYPLFLLVYKLKRKTL